MTDSLIWLVTGAFIGVIVLFFLIQEFWVKKCKLCGSKMIESEKTKYKVIYKCPNCGYEKESTVFIDSDI